MRDPNAPLGVPSEMVCCTMCAGTYDVMAVHVTARYADCSVWITPCCGKQADDRLWKSLPSYTKLSELPVVDKYGRINYP